MNLICHRCRKPNPQLPGSKPGRRDTCFSCGADLHVCLNCAHFDRSAYRECRENIVELVREKDRGNFCDAFRPASGTATAGVPTNNPNDLLKAAEALFKKK